MINNYNKDVVSHSQSPPKRHGSPETPKKGEVSGPYLFHLLFYHVILFILKDYIVLKKWENHKNQNGNNEE